MCKTYRMCVRYCLVSMYLYRNHITQTVTAIMCLPQKYNNFYQTRHSLLVLGQICTLAIHIFNKSIQLQD